MARRKKKLTKSRVGAPLGRKRGGASLKCPRCGKNTEVVVTERNEMHGNNVVLRSRRCTSCDHNFKSAEIHYVAEAAE